MVGHTLVVHAADGSRIGCGVLTSGIEASTAIATYPGYTGAAGVGTSTVTGKADHNSLTLEYDLNGLDTAVADYTGGIHIHSGYSCATAGEVGGHWWDASVADPWFTTYTVTAGASTSSGSFTITATALGYSPLTMVGHTLVVHAADGSRIGCGVLTIIVEASTAIATYPEYTGAAGVGTSTVTVIADLNSLTVVYDLNGLETAVADYTGGIHIPSGYSCATPGEVGGHWWDASVPDPWFTTYTVTAGESTSVGSFVVTAEELGYSPLLMVGHTLVVHAADGARIGCGVLTTGVEASTAIATYPEYTGSAGVGTSTVTVK